MRAWVFGFEGCNVLVLLFVLFVLAQPGHAQGSSTASISAEPISRSRNRHRIGGHRIGYCRRHLRSRRHWRYRGEA